MDRPCRDDGLMILWAGAQQSISTKWMSAQAAPRSPWGQRAGFWSALRPQRWGSCSCESAKGLEWSWQQQMLPEECPRGLWGCRLAQSRGARMVDWQARSVRSPSLLVRTMLRSLLWELSYGWGQILYFDKVTNDRDWMVTDEQVLLYFRQWIHNFWIKVLQPLHCFPLWNMQFF